MIRINQTSSISDDAWEIRSDGWCTQASHLPSPNYNDRPDGAEITLLVIHNISLPAGQFGTPYIRDLFQNCLDCDCHPSFDSLRDLKVSTHFLIQRDGALIQFVSSLDRAWHAGISTFQGRSFCNDFSIGIELEGTDYVPFEPAQYQALKLLTQALLTRFAITDIAGHEEIAPGRKTDPGPCFDWLRYQESLAVFGIGVSPA
jgi:AmpD protein